jgi:hypothetical protein
MAVLAVAFALGVPSLVTNAVAAGSSFGGGHIARGAKAVHQGSAFSVVTTTRRTHGGDAAMNGTPGVTGAPTTVLIRPRYELACSLTTRYHRKYDEKGSPATRSRNRRGLVERGGRPGRAALARVRSLRDAEAQSCRSDCDGVRAACLAYSGIPALRSASTIRSRRSGDKYSGLCSGNRRERAHFAAPPLSSAKNSVSGRSFGDWFDDCVGSSQFGTDRLHHPVLRNRRSRRRVQIGRYCGYFRRYRSALSVSGDICGLSRRF